jgi:uncharacterized membrane protein YvlD (DUF360 family)
MAEYFNDSERNNTSIMAILLRFVSGSVVLALTAFLTPGFSISNVWTLLLAAVVLTILDYAAYKIFNLKASPYGRGFSGFILTAIIIYTTQYFVPGFNVSIFGALLAAIIYGVAASIIPGESALSPRFKR